MKTALITGITGQDGSYLAEFLLEKGYHVHGIVRRVAMEDPDHRMGRIRHLLDEVELHSASLESHASIFKILLKVQPDECYHLAAQSFVSYSFEDEFSTLNTNINGTHYMLAALKDAAPKCRFYFAASSEMFGQVRETPQTESTAFHPRSAYGISKVAGFDLTRNYREAYGLHATSGILYNHESPRRGYEFVTRKITSHVAKIKLGLAHELALGNLEAKRDWGHAKDYVRAMWLMLQQEVPDDYVVATGETHSVREFAEIAFAHVGLDYQAHVVVDTKFFRPAEVQFAPGRRCQGSATTALGAEVSVPRIGGRDGGRGHGSPRRGRRADPIGGSRLNMPETAHLRPQAALGGKAGPLSRPMRLAVLPDFLEENWPSMDLCAEMLLDRLHTDWADLITPEVVRPSFRKRVSTLPWMGRRTAALNADRFLNRHLDFPRHLAEAAHRIRSCFMCAITVTANSFWAFLPTKQAFSVTTSIRFAVCWSRSATRGRAGFAP